MGCRLAFTILAARLDVVTPRVQTINNVATCTAGEAAWEDAPFLPEVSAPFVPFRPPRKMRSLISVQVSEPRSLSANCFPNMRALVPKVRAPQAPKVSDVYCF
ncbi:hypothetical protein TNCV_1089661 [Trichonephila clavipes]|uniref:Uncharacterized protein n=1 Tax=Trichonephila clavipes TaxID=2585209 RepID=A0A8X6STL3_TRICX|nr:hypothetical protein TNCV_1089661 [Trichonephila clavipes]